MRYLRSLMCNHKDKCQGLEHTSQVSHCNTIVSWAFLGFVLVGRGGGLLFLVIDIAYSCCTYLYNVIESIFVNCI